MRSAGPDAGESAGFGVEYVVANVGQPQPSLFGGAFDGPMAGLSPGMPEHYDRPVWTWQADPDEIFARWNTTVRRGSQLSAPSTLQDRRGVAESTAFCISTRS